MKDKKACIFYFLMNIILLDFGNQIRKISYSPYLENFNNPIFSIFHINNTGSAFGLFQNGAIFLSFIGLFAVIVLAFYVFQNIKFSDKTALLSLTLFSSGTLGNLIERIQNGYVVDYIKLNFINFPIFNCFDIMISIGLILYICFILFSKDNKENTNGWNWNNHNIK